MKKSNGGIKVSTGLKAGGFWKNHARNMLRVTAG